MKVQLKKPHQFNFNKTSGNYHFSYDLAKEVLGLEKQYEVIQTWLMYGQKRVKIKDEKGRIILGQADYPLSYFNIINED